MLLDYLKNLVAKEVIRKSPTELVRNGDEPGCFMVRESAQAEFKCVRLKVCTECCKTSPEPTCCKQTCGTSAPTVVEVPAAMPEAAPVPEVVEAISATPAVSDEPEDKPVLATEEADSDDKAVKSKRSRKH